MAKSYSEIQRQAIKEKIAMDEGVTHTPLIQDTTVSRRGFVASGLAGTLGLLEGRPAAAKESKKEEWIDAHVHVWTPDTLRYPLAKGFKKADMAPASFTPVELFNHCKPVGVTRIVLIQMSFYGLDNSYMTDMMKLHKGVFSGVAVIDENNKPGQTMKDLGKVGVRGFRILPFKDPKKWLEGDGMVEMWKTAARTGQAICCLTNPENLLQIDAMCEKHPETTVVIDHFGRIGPNQEKDLDNLCRLARHKKTSVKISAYYAFSKQKDYLDMGPMIRRLLDAYGPSRLMWASDCPFQVNPGHNYADSINLIKHKLDFLSQGDKEQLLQKTAERLFFPI